MPPKEATNKYPSGNRSTGKGYRPTLSTSEAAAVAIILMKLIIYFALHIFGFREKWR